MIKTMSKVKLVMRKHMIPYLFVFLMRFALDVIDFMGVITDYIGIFLTDKQDGTVILSSLDFKSSPPTPTKPQ